MSEKYSPQDIAAALQKVGAKIFDPTAEQSAIISISTNPLEPAVVIAGAGSGKTETMSNRVLYLVANGFATPDQILGLTFTRKAAGELSVRIRKRLRQLSQLKEFNKSEKSVEVFIEVNIAEEEQKSGILQNSLDSFARDVIRCEQANLSGLMTIGPVVKDAEQSRPYFKKLRQLGESIGTKNLSMGMSLDFEVGIQEGATHIRVGTLLFGARD
jgi:hypothetical protein